MDEMQPKSANEIEQATEKLLQDLKQAVQDGETLLQKGAERLGERGAEARARLAEALEAARETGRKLQERALATSRATDRLIREHPYQSLSIAFGLGLLIGLLVTRNR